MASQLVSLFQQKMVIQNKTIDSLPNEILRAVLDKVDVQALIVARRVSRRWLNVIEHICEKKTSIVIVANGFRGDISNLSSEFNYLVNFNKNCALLKTKSNNCELSNNLSNLLTRLFPHVECLAILGNLDKAAFTATVPNLFTLLAHWSSTITTLCLPDIRQLNGPLARALEDHIDKLTALKRLEWPNCQYVKQSTFDRLEHIYAGHGHAHYIVKKAGPACTSLYFTELLFSVLDLKEMIQHNAPLVKRVTHLHLAILANLADVCATFPSLQMLNIMFLEVYTFDDKLIAPLAQLTNLSQLRISNFTINLATLALVDLPVLSSVRILEMGIFGFNDHDDDQLDGELFCRLFSIIFPSLEQITIHYRLVCAAIRPHLYRFTNLRTHSITSQYAV